MQSYGAVGTILITDISFLYATNLTTSNLVVLSESTRPDSVSSVYASTIIDGDNDYIGLKAIYLQNVAVSLQNVSLFAFCNSSDVDIIISEELCRGTEIMVQDSVVSQIRDLSLEENAIGCNIAAGVLNISGTSKIFDCNTIALHGDTFSLSSNSTVSFTREFIADFNEDMYIQGEVRQLQGTPQSCWENSGVKITAFGCDSIVSKRGSYSVWKGDPNVASGGLLAMKSSKRIVIESGRLLSTSLLMCGANIALDRLASVSADNYGCAMNDGKGRGGDGAGGGFGGRGGMSGNNTAGGSAYGSYDFNNGTYTDQLMLYTGSGGGGCHNLTDANICADESYSRGGGVVLINASTSLTMDGTVTASGGNGTTVSGGGSGGSIVIASPGMVGQGFIYARGGSGRNGSAVDTSAVTGGGGGGRILYDSQGNYSYSAFKGWLSVLGGNGSSDATTGGAGTITSLVCPPGQYHTANDAQLQLVQCTPCPTGRYKDAASNGECIKCPEDLKPSESFFVGTGMVNEECAFECKHGLKYEFDDCLTEFQIFVEALGGQTIFAALASGIVVFVFLPLMILRNLRANGLCKRRATEMNYNTSKRVEKSLSSDWFTGTSGTNPVDILNTEDTSSTVDSSQAAQDDVARKAKIKAFELESPSISPMHASAPVPGALRRESSMRGGKLLFSLHCVCY